MNSDQSERCYWCPPCDVYGCGTRCWMCESADVTWSDLPRYALLSDMASRSFRRSA